MKDHARICPAMSDAVAAIGCTPDPDQSWPVWRVDLLFRLGGHAGDSCEMAAPDPATAIRWVDDVMAGTRFRASRHVAPARLHPDHPRFAATEAARRTTTPDLEEVA